MPDIISRLAEDRNEHLVHMPHDLCGGRLHTGLRPSASYPLSPILLGRNQAYVLPSLSLLNPYGLRGLQDVAHCHFGEKLRKEGRRSETSAEEMSMCVPKQVPPAASLSFWVLRQGKSSDRSCRATTCLPGYEIEIPLPESQSTLQALGDFGHSGMSVEYELDAHGTNRLINAALDLSPLEERQMHS
jgi:hypothetical protein